MLGITRNRQAFTLVELIVAIGIMAVLAGMLMGGIQVARRSLKRTQASTLIKDVGLAIKTFEAEWGRFPVDHIELLDSVNTVSIANLSTDAEKSNAVLMFQLLSTKKNGPYLEPDEKDLDNPTGADAYAISDNSGDSPDDVIVDWNSKYETRAPLLLDPWGQPLLYDRNFPEESAAPRYNPTHNNPDTTGANFRNLKTFDLWSIGENGLDDELAYDLNRQPDDITNW